MEIIIVCYDIIGSIVKHLLWKLVVSTNNRPRFRVNGHKRKSIHPSNLKDLYLRDYSEKKFKFQRIVLDNLHEGMIFDPKYDQNDRNFYQNDRCYHQNNRYFFQNDRYFHKNDRYFYQNNRSLNQNDRNLNQNNRDLNQNDRNLNLNDHILNQNDRNFEPK